MSKGKIVRIVIVAVVAAALVLTAVHLSLNWEGFMQTMRDLHGG